MIKRGAGGGKGGEGTGGAGLFVRGNYKYFLWGRGRNVAGGRRGRGGRALGRTDVGVGYTRGARSRRWCGYIYDLHYLDHVCPRVGRPRRGSCTHVCRVGSAHATYYSSSCALYHQILARTGSREVARTRGRTRSQG